MTFAGTPTPTVTMPTRLLATHVLAPTQQAGIITLRGEDLVNLLSPWAADAYAKHTGDDSALPTPIAEDWYPADQAADSAAEGLLALKKSIAGDTGPIVVVGLSQGARVISLYKQEFNEQYQDGDPIPTFVVVGNSSRPNGGMVNRLASLGINPGNANSTPTETKGVDEGVITTYDYAHQYDWFADFPNRPLNPFSLVNAVFGILLSHASYGEIDAESGLAGLILQNNPYGTVGPEDAVSQGQYGDTQYYLLPSKVLPMLQPLAFIGIPKPLIAVLDAPLRVLVEAGYDRTISPGQPTGARLLPAADIIRTLTNFVRAIPVGIDDGLQQTGLGRPLRTTAAGPYGVGGPPVTPPQSVNSVPTDTDLVSTAVTAAHTASSLDRVRDSSLIHQTVKTDSVDSLPGVELTEGNSAEPSPKVHTTESDTTESSPSIEATGLSGAPSSGSSATEPALPHRLTIPKRTKAAISESLARLRTRAADDSDKTSSARGDQPTEHGASDARSPRTTHSNGPRTKANRVSAAAAGD